MAQSQPSILHSDQSRCYKQPCAAACVSIAHCSRPSLYLFRNRVGRLMEENLTTKETETKSELELPDDLIREILQNVTIKTMMTFKTISKNWLRLIHTNTNPFATSFFILRQQIDQKLTDSNPIIIVPVSILPNDDRSRSSDGITINPLPQIDLQQQQIVEIRGGKLLITPASCGVFSFFESISGTVSIWNPTNKQIKVLPSSPYYPTKFSRHLLQFATVAKGQDSVISSYKIGRVTYEFIKNQRLNLLLSLELYSSETKTWKFIPNFFTSKFTPYHGHSRQCAVLNGKAHWFIYSPDDDIHITAFDYETEVFTRIKAPSGGYDNFLCLVTLFDDKFLCLGLYTLTIGDDRILYLDIWVLRKYGDEDSWVKEFRVGPLYNDMEVLGFSSKVQTLFLRDPRQYPGCLLFCDCKSSKFKYLQIGNCLERHMQVVEYVGSNVSLLNL